ncbi:hypothetical protein MMC29_003307 [Sticta canariensis]|nr:hypothetical protein [Sticta canariensis]
MTSTRVAEVKQARALVLADYVRSRAVRAAENDQREKGRDDGTLSTNKGSDKESPHVSSKRKVRGDDDDAGQRPIKVAKNGDRRGEALQPKERHITAKPKPFFDHLKMVRKPKPPMKPQSRLESTEVVPNPAASKKRKAGQIGEDNDAGQRPTKLAKTGERRGGALQAKERCITTKPQPAFDHLKVVRKPNPSTKSQSRVEPAVAAPKPAASQKRKAAPRVDECASKKPRLVKEVIGQSVAKSIAAKPNLRKPSLLESIIARFPAPKLPKSGLKTPVEPPNVAGARKGDDEADAKVEDQNDKAEVKVKAGADKRAATSSKKRKAKESLPRPAKK